MRQFKIILMVLVAVAIAASAYMSLIIERQHLAIAQISNNNTAFTGSQSAAELLRLRGLLQDYSYVPSPDTAQQVRLRYDIALNRLSIMSRGEFGTFMRLSPRHDLLLDSYNRTMERVGEILDAGLTQASARQMSDMLAFYERPLMGLASEANQFGAQEAADGQRDLLRLQEISFYITLALVACGALLVSMILRANGLLGKADDARRILLDELQATSADLTLRNLQLDRMAHFDPLTGLANRTLFASELDRQVELVRRENRSFALLLLDLDGFKSINDTRGHYAGDELLRQVAMRIRAMSPGEAFCARLGGDEFAVICCDPDDAAVSSALVAAMIVRQIALPFLIEGDSVQIGVSIGFVGCDRGNFASADELIRRADDALYQAKRQGKGRVEHAVQHAA